MSHIFIKNIKQLVQVDSENKTRVNGLSMAHLPILENAWLWIENDEIKDFGSMDQLPDLQSVKEKIDILDVTGKLVFPSWCDSHTHLVYAGSRESEFVYKIKGMSYEEIFQNGGGILNSAKKLQETSEEVLLQSALSRLHEIILFGTGAVEIKSGYGLTTEAEIKMLRVIKKLKSLSPIHIKATFLGAHAMPIEFKNDRQAYIQKITQEMLPIIANEGLADYVDVFCDKGFYTPQETDQILQAAAVYGLKPKIHANELDFSGGIQIGVKNKAVSVDHLEYTGEEEINVLKSSQTIPTLLPTTAFFLRLPHYPPARKMLDSDLPVALATDYNPGSSPSGNMPFVLSLACIQMKMLPEEVINASTLNGAAAMEIGHSHGSIAKGKKANFFITKEIPSYTFLPYSFGSQLIESVYLNGIKY